VDVARAAKKPVDAAWRLARAPLGKGLCRGGRAHREVAHDVEEELAHFNGLRPATARPSEVFFGGAQLDRASRQDGAGDRQHCGRPTPGSGGSYGSAFAVLKPLSERQASAREVADRLKTQLEQIAGAALYLGADQDVRVGAREGNGGYQYTLLGEDTGELSEWAPKVSAAPRH
jgi:hypothetical protein